MLMICSSNMLYPKEDPDTHRLQFACRTCQFSEEATSSCVFRNVLNNAVGETAGVTQDVGSDPTVCLLIFCTHQTSALSAQIESARLGADNSLCWNDSDIKTLPGRTFGSQRLLRASKNILLTLRDHL